MIMKKRIIITGLIVICIALAVAGIFFFKKDKKNEAKDSIDKEISLYEEILNVSSLKEYEKLTKSIENESVLGEDKSGATIEEFALFHENAVITYYFDVEGNVREFETWFHFNEGPEENSLPEEITVEELRDKTEGVLKAFCKMFGVLELPDLYLTHSDGTYEKIESIDSYQKMIEGIAWIDFSVRDESGTYWTIRVYSESNLCTVDIWRYFDTEGYKDYFANISLYEEKEK